MSSSRKTGITSVIGTLTRKIDPRPLGLIYPPCKADFAIQIMAYGA
ncbi:MAG: hypothetical protein AAF249_07890 [Pseudomonadota bacterium]